MGIIIAPILLAALYLMGVSIFHTIRLLRRKEIGWQEILWALLLSAVIFGLICVSYLIAGRAWGLSPAFRIPVCMFFLPYGVYWISQKTGWPALKTPGRIALIIVGISGIAAIVTHDLFLGLVSHLGVTEYY